MREAPANTWTRTAREWRTTTSPSLRPSPSGTRSIPTGTSSSWPGWMATRTRYGSPASTLTLLSRGAACGTTPARCGSWRWRWMGEVLVPGRGTPPRCGRRLRRARRCRGADHRLARAARHRPRRTSRPAGRDRGRDVGGRDGAAPHLPRRRPASPSAFADQLRVFAKGHWRGLDTVAIRDSIAAINGIGHAAVATDPAFRDALAAHGYTLTGSAEITQLAPTSGRSVSGRRDRAQPRSLREGVRVIHPRGGTRAGVASGVGLEHGAGDGNRTRTFSLED